MQLPPYDTYLSVQIWYHFPLLYCIYKAYEHGSKLTFCWNLAFKTILLLFQLFLSYSYAWFSTPRDFWAKKCYIYTNHILMLTQHCSDFRSWRDPRQRPLMASKRISWRWSPTTEKRCSIITVLEHIFTVHNNSAFNQKKSNILYFKK